MPRLDPLDWVVIGAYGAVVFAIGVGTGRLDNDSEVLSLSVGEAALAESSVRLETSAVRHGSGTTPVEVRILEDGRPLQVRRVSPPAEGLPVRLVAQVSPKADVPTLYTVEVPIADEDPVPENNRRSVLVRPPGRPRRNR